VWGDTYHLFYQYNPDAPVHHAIHWGHLTSTDLVRWRDEPIALEPEPGPDQDGCWSGVLVDDDGVPTLVYSGRRDGVESACLAVGSPDLRTWRRDPANPVVAGPPAELRTTAFRDHAVWREDGAWHMLIGSGVVGVGGTALYYVSRDLRSWEYRGPLVTGDASDHPDDVVTDADNRAWSGTMWECVDLFDLPAPDGGSRTVLVFSAWDDGRTLHPMYLVGRLDGDAFVPEGPARLLDLGRRHFYAPQSFTDPRDGGRRVIYGWMQEARTENADREAGWSGVLTLPRELSLGPDGRLCSKPVPEVAALRGEALDMSGGGAQAVQADLVADLVLPDGGRVDVTMLATPDGAERTVLTVVRRGDLAEIRLDRSISSLDPTLDVGPLGGGVAVDESGRLTLRLLLDRSVVEAFIAGMPLSARVYPTRADATGLGVTASAGAWIEDLRAWALGDAFTGPRAVAGPL
jgi:beta-fructofuranosidase